MKKRRIIIVSFILCLFFAISSSALYENGEGIYSDNVYMENLETGRVVIDVNSDEKVFPASLTKILTCILAIEKCEDLSESFEIPRGIFDDIYAQGGAHISLKYGEVVTVSDLLHATLIRSACDTATALAYYVSGDVEAFANDMNTKAHEIGATSTHFVNAHGLHDDSHYTTAKDMALIAKYALQNQTFCDIISKWNYTMPATNMSEERYFETTMDVENPESDAYYPYITGIKSGFTDEAGRCLITKAQKDGETFLLVTLGANRDRYYLSNMAFTDAVNLYEYCFARFSFKNIIEKDIILSSVNVEEGLADTVSLTASRTQSYLCAVDEDVSVTYNIPERVKAPVMVGDEIGSVTVTVDEYTVTEPLFATADVKAVPKSSFISDNSFINILNVSTVVIYAISIIVLVLFCTTFYSKKKKRIK